MLSGISLTCFAASYAVSLALEISRLFFRAPIRLFITLGFAIAGLFAHTVYLWMRAQEAAGTGLPLSSWYDWCLLGAWLLVAVYLAVATRRPQAAVGVFLLPLVLALIGVAWLFRNAPPFPQAQAKSLWGQLHGLALLGGTVVVMLGFAAGVMYLVQSYRLKHKLPPRPGFQLPSLEWLQRVNKFALYVSSVLLAVGLLSGIVLNLVKTAGQSGAVPWTDPLVLSSAALLLWLVVSSLFEFCYRPARAGRKIAYLTVASFVFLAAVLGIAVANALLGAAHGTARRNSRYEQRVPVASSPLPCLELQPRLHFVDACPFDSAFVLPRTEKRPPVLEARLATAGNALQCGAVRLVVARFIGLRHLGSPNRMNAVTTSQNRMNAITTSQNRMNAITTSTEAQS